MAGTQSTAVAYINFCVSTIMGIIFMSSVMRERVDSTCGGQELEANFVLRRQEGPDLNLLIRTC